MDQEKINKILELHKKWVLSNDGERAYLSGANLNGADLNGADFSGANLSRAYLSGAYLSRAKLTDDFVLTSSNCRYLQLSDYYTWVFDSKKGLVMTIGCECHLVEDWKNFTDEKILGMDSRRALKFWRKEKEILMLVCESMK